MFTITNKLNRLALLDAIPQGGVCAELGVLEGSFSAEILARTKPKHLYLVDLFKGTVRSGDQNGENMREYDMEHIHDNLKWRFLNQPVTIVKSDSITWLSEQEKGSLDWVYIDTTHEYERTCGELAAALVAVKDDGFICGHDYSQAYIGVVQAVDQFASYYGLPVEIFSGDALASYRIRKLRVEDGWSQRPTPLA